ncbi:hypothetical protein GGS23DRAFT_198586 [Durotheca rogersii]|uniref:uncharacterized protein n=1 Tax=Durotheca rogersii TaxID=419775 RepID=UPI00221F1FFA|nr:uncharacterized protein GGS23DRAFT_198586 [Durotheca rogersii]KAI5867821.1 hypothetical protein GGS23DRAFT_198586 [Durotheca rogersii]
MSEPRRYVGRQSSPPMTHPARLSMPITVGGGGYNPHYGSDLHAIQTGRYDATVPRRANDHSHKAPAAPPTTVTTYSVTKDSSQPPRNSAQAARRRSSTVDATAVKPVIVTTSHPPRPHGSTSHTSSSATRTASPSRDPFRSSDETYYTQPASSMRSRSQYQGHGYSQSATLGNDEYYRLRERVGEDRLRPPTHTSTDYYRYPVTHPPYTNPPHASTSAVIDYENEGYEYTKPSDLARYDLDHGHQPRKGRRDSFDRPYYRPTVNVVSNEPGRYDSRTRGPPPPSVGLERYGRAAAVSTYDRPTVTMPMLPPPVPAAPPVDALRRIEGPRTISAERTSDRPRPVSLYQDAPARMSHPDDLYRSRDDDRVHVRRARDDTYRDDNVATRGFGIRTNSLEPPAILSGAPDRRDHEYRHARRDAVDREPRRRPDDTIEPNSRDPRDTRKPSKDTPIATTTRVDSSRDQREAMTRKNSISGRVFDKFVAGAAAAATSLGLTSKDAAAKEEERKPSPRRRDTADEKDTEGPRAADRYKPKDRDVAEQRPSARDEQVLPERRREPRGERTEESSASRERDYEREADRERERDQRERNRRDVEAALDGSAVEDTNDKPLNSDGSANTSRRRRHGSSTFDPTDAKGLMELKAELAAKDEQESAKEDLASKDKPSDKDSTAATVASGSAERSTERSTERSAERQQPADEPREESRGREAVSSAEKQVRVVSPPREKSETKPIKGILKAPSAKFPEEENPIREGVAPHKDDKTKKDVPAGARWTKISRKLVNPMALEIGKERYEVRDDFVIVLRVLSKEEIQAYATATAKIRADVRRREHEREHENGHDRDRSDEDRRTNNSNGSSNRPHRRRERDRDDDYDERERPQPHRRRGRGGAGSDEDDAELRRRAIEYEPASGGGNHVRPHRPHRERDYELVGAGADDRR